MFIIRVPSEGLELYQRLKEYMDYYNNDLCIQRINHQILNKQRFSGSKMIFRTNCKDNQTTEPVKIKTSPFRDLNRTCKLIEEVFTREKSSKRKTYI